MRDCCCFDSFSANAVWLRCMANGGGTATGDALLWPGDAFFEMYGSGGLSWWAKKESGCLAEGFKLLLVVVVLLEAIDLEDCCSPIFGSGGCARVWAFDLERSL